MRITPLDIQQKQFPYKLRGFDDEEVYAFLELIREEMEDLLRENASLKENAIRQEKVIKIHEDIVDLKGIRRHFKEELKRLIEGHLKMIEYDKEREEEGQGMTEKCGDIPL